MPCVLKCANQISSSQTSMQIANCIPNFLLAKKSYFKGKGMQNHFFWRKCAQNAYFGGRCIEKNAKKKNPCIEKFLILCTFVLQSMSTGNNRLMETLAGNEKKLIQPPLGCIYHQLHSVHQLSDNHALSKINIHASLTQ